MWKIHCEISHFVFHKNPYKPDTLKKFQSGDGFYVNYYLLNVLMSYYIHVS